MAILKWPIHEASVIDCTVCSGMSSQDQVNRVIAAICRRVPSANHTECRLALNKYIRVGFRSARLFPIAPELNFG